MKLLLICLLTFMFVNNSIAQEKETNPKHAIGVAAGFTTAYGLSYRYTPNRFGVQATFAPFSNKTITNISTGLTFTYTLIPGNTTSLYLYQGNHFFYHTETLYYYDAAKTMQAPDATSYSDRQNEHFFNNGVGFGMEILFAKRIGFNLMAGYASYVNFTQINVTGEVGLYFKF